jgi:hypothetical protein
MITELTIGDLMRAHSKLRAEIDRFNVEIKERKAQMDALELQIGQQLKETGLDSFKVGRDRAEFIDKVGYKITDYNALTDYIYAQKALYLMHRRLLLEPLVEALEQNQDIPGVDVYKYPQLTIRKS